MKLAENKETQNSSKFDISNLNYHGTHVHVASKRHFGGNLDNGGLQTSKRPWMSHLVSESYQVASITYVACLDGL